MLAIPVRQALCAWHRVALLLPSPWLRLGAAGSAGIAGSPIELKSGIGDVAVRIRMSRSGLGGTAVAGVQFIGSNHSSLWVAFSLLLVERMTSHQHAAILTGMTLSRRDIANAAVAMLVVVPAHEARHPLPGGVQLGEPSGRELRPILFAVRNSASTKALSSLTRGRE
jgi:hypothetical protein